MIRRLVEVSYFDATLEPTSERVDFWLQELRSPELLVECVARFPDAARAASITRPAVAVAVALSAAANAGTAAATAGTGVTIASEVERELDAEMRGERARDRDYWAPLRVELKALRRARPNRADTS